VHLAGVEEMKPILWMSPDGKVSPTEGKLFHIPLFAIQEWQYLTDDEIKEIVGGYSSKDGIGNYTRTLIDKIEAKIKEKNDIFSS
jgi:hypothetical protein